MGFGRARWAEQVGTKCDRADQRARLAERHYRYFGTRRSISRAGRNHSLLFRKIHSGHLSPSEDRQRHRDDAGDPRCEKRRGSFDARTIGGIVEKTIEAMVENANPGVSERELYGAMVHAMLANGGELPTLFFLSAGPGLSNSSFVPTDYRIQKGDRIIDEIEAKYAGYAAQAVCPVVLGAPDDEYQKMIDISRACFDSILHNMKPGV